MTNINDLLKELTNKIYDYKPANRDEYLLAVKFYRAIDLLKELDLYIANSISDEVIDKALEIQLFCCTNKVYMERKELEEVIGELNVLKLIIIGCIYIDSLGNIKWNYDKDSLNIGKISYFRNKKRA